MLVFREGYQKPKDSWDYLSLFVFENPAWADDEEDSWRKVLRISPWIEAASESDKMSWFLNQDFGYIRNESKQQDENTTMLKRYIYIYIYVSKKNLTFHPNLESNLSSNPPFKNTLFFRPWIFRGSQPQPPHRWTVATSRWWPWMKPKRRRRIKTSPFLRRSWSQLGSRWDDQWRDYIWLYHNHTYGQPINHYNLFRKNNWMFL